MAANGKQKLKLLHLLRMLEEETDAEHGLSMTQILGKLAQAGIPAERKGIYRDLNTLREFGLNITTIARMPVEYTLEKSGLNVDEFALLVNIVCASGDVSEHAAKRLVKKLASYAGKHEREALRVPVRMMGRIERQGDSVFKTVRIVQTAIADKRKVEFTSFSYSNTLHKQDRNGGKPYAATPVEVVFDRGAGYLVAWMDAEQRFARVRLDRMRRVSVLEEAGAGIAYADYDDSVFESLPDGEHVVEPCEVSLRLAADAPDIADALVDRFGSGIEPELLEDGSAQFVVSTPLEPQFFGWVAGLSPALSVAGPKRAVQAYRAWAESLVR